MNCKYFLILFYFFGNILFGQNVTISGNLFLTNSSTITLDKSFDNNPEHFIIKNDSIILKDNFFKKSFTLNSKGVVFLNLKQDPYQVLLVCEPKDNIIINFQEKNENNKMQFQGSNAIGMDFINNSNLLKELYRPIFEIYDKVKTGNEVRIKTDSLINKKMQPLDLMLANKEITNTFYECVKLYLESEIITLSYAYLEDYLRLDKSSMSTNLSEIEIKNAIKLLDSKYDVFDSKYNIIKTRNFYHAIINKCIFIDKKVISGKSQNYVLWNENEKQKYNFAPKQLQEFLIYNEITNADFDTKLYDNYKAKIPNGIYLNVLKSKFNKAIIAQTLPINSFGKLDSNSNKLDLISSVEFKDLEDLIDRNLKGKAVFVDLWATFCTPCKEEFKYSDEVDAFLKTKDVEILYLSIDANNNFAGSAIRKWEKDIYKFNLKGYHYYASKEFVQNLASKLNVNTLAIPRYLLINNNGQMVSKQLNYPSSKEVLFDEINKILNK